MKLKRLMMATLIPLLLSVFTSDSLANTKHSVINQLGEYLYLITYQDYDYDDYLSVRNENKQLVDFGCSAVHNGQFFGRNFDAKFDEVPQYIIYVPSTQDRYASIGMAYSFSKKTFAEMDENAYTSLPWSMVDGVNEKGVAVCVSTCPTKDLEFYIARLGTAFGKPELDLSTVTRFLLDNAQSAKHAVELLQGRNILDNIEKPKSSKVLPSGFHFMIADEKEQYIVEFISNQMCITKDDPVMTNFFNTLLPQYTAHSKGIERYNVMKEHYKWGAKGLDGMSRLMKAVMFTRAYDVSNYPVRYTDVGLGYDKDLDVDVTNGIINNDFKMKNHIMDRIATTRVRRNEPGVWQTASTSVYDLKNLIFRLYSQEDYSRCFEFALKE